MNEYLTSRQRRRELLITLAYTIFSVLMIIVTAIESWPIAYVPLIAAEIALVWWCYSQQTRSYLFRASIVTTMICINMFLYGIQGENFFVLIPTLCVEFVLLSLYELTRIMYIAILETIMLFVYHVVVKKDFMLPDSSLERNRMILQMLSLVALIILCLYRIYHHAQEESDIMLLEKQVRREQRVKDNFVANTSHELRTPVNTISGMCEILLQKSLPDDVHRGVLDIQMTGVELQSIVNDILDYAALEQDTLTLSPRSYNITSTLNDVMNMSVFENRDKNLEIIFDCDPNIPCLLEGDEQQLRRVLNNLISNAIKFTNEGGVSVRVSYRPEEYGINLIVSIKDTGVGMSLEDQDRILRGFYQTDGDRNRTNAGMGLGLTISSALIRKMGGFLTVKSELGVGSDFSFSIPQKVVNDQPCISLSHPASIRLIWFYNPSSTVTGMRDAFVEHVRHFSDSFGISSQRATSLEECKRYVAQSRDAHLILGKQEYLQDKSYFDEISRSLAIILIADRGENFKVAPHIHVLYKPYNAIMLAEIFNGQEHSSLSRRREQRMFVAPSAKILVVDDNLMNLKVVEGLLRKYRVKIVAASSGEEALTLIESQDFDFVFMDHMMPGMDGVECFRHIREKQGAYYMQVPIIALTANAIAGSREMFLSEGFSEFIAKPIDTSILNDVLRRFIPMEKQIYADEIAGITREEFLISAQEFPSPSKLEEPEAAAVATAAEIEVPAAETPSAAASTVSAPPSVAPATPSSPDTDEDPFAALPGIDKETALLYCGSVEDFRELAEVYCESGRTYAADLQNAFNDMDLKHYALLSHTVKSTSKTLGALALSDMALAQEMAAKEEREDDVRKQHEEFHKEYSRVLDMLSGYLWGEAPAEETVETAAEDNGTEVPDWAALKAELRQCLESYEVKAFEDCLTRAKGQTLQGQPLEDALAEVLQQASNYDFDSAMATLEGIGGAA